MRNTTALDVDQARCAIGSPQALAAIMAADTARWAPIIKATGFTAE